MKLEKNLFADAWLGKFGTNEYEMVMEKDVQYCNEVGHGRWWYSRMHRCRCLQLSIQ